MQIYLFKNYLLCLGFRGPFRWSNERNTLLLREAYVSEPFLYKAGSKEAGQKWTLVADNLNCFGLFHDMPRDQHSVRDQFNKIMGNYKKKKSMEEKASGITPDPPTENEKILEDIIEMLESTPIKNPAVDSRNEEKKRKEALATREIAMTTWKKAAKHGEDEQVEDEEDSGDENLGEKPKPARKRKRRSCTDPIQYLVQKTTNENELRKEELEIRRQELQLKAEQQKQQFQLQQLQLQQMMETQKNTQNLFVTVIEKLSK